MIFRKENGNNKDSIVLWFIIASTVILLDQSIKLLVRLKLKVIGPIKILPFLSFNYTENTGAGFGILQQQNIFLAILSLIVIVTFILFFYKLTETKVEKIFLSLIIAGAIGNLIDRLILGFVVDFIQVPRWPIFNIADMSLSVGAVGLIILQFLKNKKHKLNFKQE